jgi:hypothetical protein
LGNCLHVRKQDRQRLFLTLLAPSQLKDRFFISSVRQEVEPANPFDRDDLPAPNRFRRSQQRFIPDFECFRAAIPQ